jgi:hypothetical protein
MTAVTREQKRAWERNYYQANKQKRLERQRRFREENPQAYRDWYLRTKYGLTQGEFEAMLASQGGLCAICSLPMGTPKIDHNHDTGEVRGLLCSPCNTGIGHLKDSPEVLFAAYQYVSTH